MSLTIGRVVLPRTADATLDGRTLRLSGTIQASSSAVAVGLRQRLAGYVDNPDEPVVPVVWSVDSTLDGYYRMVSATVVFDRDRSYTSRGQFNYQWSAVLEQIVGFAAPVIEGHLIGTTRSNAASIASGSTRTWHAVPNDVKGYDAWWSTGGADTSVTTSNGHTIRKLYFNTSLASGNPGTTYYFNARPNWYCAPADYYDGACSIWINNELTVGRQVINDPTEWIVSNELVKVEPGSTTGYLKFSWWDGSAWDPFEFVPGYTTGGGAWVAFDDDHPHSAVVLRSSPETVTLRLSYPGYLLFAVPWTFTIDLTVRRGARYVECMLTPSQAFPAIAYGISRTTTDAATAATGGIVDTSATNGTKYILASPLNVTKSTTPGRLYLASDDTKFPFMVGGEVGGAADPWDAQTIIYEYFGAVTERMKVQTR